MDRSDVGFAALAVVGAALLLYGLTLPSFTGELVVGEPAASTAVDGDEVVAYEDLSEDNRAAFDRALDAGGETNYQHGRWNHEVVRYDGQYYPTSTWGGENAWRLWTIIAGLGVTGFGVVGFGTLRLYRRLSDD